MVKRSRSWRGLLHIGEHGCGSPRLLISKVVHAFVMFALLERTTTELAEKPIKSRHNMVAPDTNKGNVL